MQTSQSENQLSPSTALNLASQVVKSPTSLAYNEALRYVITNGVEVGPRGQSTLEVSDYSFKVESPTSEPIITFDEERNKVIKEYTEKELELYRNCSNKAEDFAKASAFWKAIKNPDDTINSAYGYLLWKNKSCGNPAMASLGKFEGINGEVPRFMTPWEWAKECLIRDRETRQAFIRFSLPTHQWFGNRDQTCTMHGVFSIRADRFNSEKLRLNLSIVMRSNDLVKGLVYDMPFFVYLIERMAAELRFKYPNLVVGYYSHMAHSFHIYRKNENTALKMIGRS